MSLFDQEEQQPEDDIRFDEDSKIRLFETHQKSTASVHDYVKKFLPFAVVALVGLGVVYYLMLPGIGDEVRASDQMHDAVYDYMLTKEKRTPKEMTFYKCDGFHWARVWAEPRAYPPSNPYDDVNKFRVSVNQQADSSFQITTLPTGGPDTPCQK